MSTSRSGIDGSAAASADESRYQLLVKIASGGMATVYLGEVRGAAGFRRYVAIKRAHAHLLENPAFKQMLIEEARLASGIHHPNVVSVLDVEEREGELLLVMDYVEGAALSDLLTKAQEAERRFPARIAIRIVLDACAGLHAAHELADENGKPLGLVHRDISPHNILVGIDGAARIADFGIAKQADRGVSTTTGSLKGKLGYMAPEYVEHGVLDARSDVFALGIVAWEALAHRKLFRGSNEVDTLKKIVSAEVPPLSQVAPWVGARLDDVLAAALARLPVERFDSARAFGNALESAARKDDLIASANEVAALVQELAGPALEKRRAQLREKSGSHRGGLAAARTPPVAPPSTPELTSVDRPTLPDKPLRHDEAAPEMTGSMGGSSRSVPQARAVSEVSSPSLPLARTGRTAVIAIAGLVMLVAAVLLIVRFIGTEPKELTTSAAPVNEVTSPPVETNSAVITPAGPAGATASAPSASPAPSAAALRASTSASARPWGTLPPRAKGTSAPAGAPVERVAPNPYATPAKPTP